MADNYLEKKYEELRQGKPVVRRNTPSLDTLLRRVGETAEIDTAYIVKQAQLDALVRSAGLLGCDCCFQTFETSANSPAYVRISCPDGPFNLGQAVMAVRLKAAELCLDSLVEPVTSAGEASGTVSVTVSVFRRRS